VLLLAPLVPLLLLGQVYRWVDKSGETHFTDDRNSIPKGVKAMPFEPGEPDVSLGSVPESSPVAAPPLPLKGKSTERAPAPEAPRAEAPTLVLDPLPASLKGGDAEILLNAVQQAIESPRLKSLGGLRKTVHLNVIEKQDDPRLAHLNSLAVGFAGSATQIFLLSPYIGVVAYGRPRPWAEIVLHEVAHAQQFQFTGPQRVPRWFAEGYAMFVAGQQAYASKEDMAWWAIEKGSGAPLSTSFSGAGGLDYTLTHYALALEALTLMIETRGEPGVAALLRDMRDGQSFEAAFRKGQGMTVSELEALLLARLKPHFHTRGQ